MTMLLALLSLALQVREDVAPFELVKNIIVVRGSVNDQPATFIFDTGASHTILTPEAARRLGVEGVESGQCRSLGAGSALVYRLTVGIADPPQAHFVRHAGVDYAGIIGTTFLERFIITIDYRHRQIRFLPAADAGPLKPEPGAHIVPFDMKHNLIWVDAKANGRADLLLVFDCGANATVLVPEAARRMALSGRPVRDQDQRPFELATLESLAVGPAEVPAMEVAVADIEQLHPLRRVGQPYDGLLGYNFLSQFRVTIDYRRRQMRLALPEEDPRAPLGLTLAETRVRTVEPGSLAARAGFREGDLIVSVNGQYVQFVEEIRAIIGGGKPGATFTFSVRRGGEPLTLRIKR